MSPSPRWPVDVPTRLRPVRMISAGSSSNAWEVVDSSSGRRGVLKTVADDGVDELRALARLGEVEGVVPILELGALRRGGAWLLLPMLDGGSLLERVQTAPPADDQLLAWGVRLAGALAAAHSADVAHGDISPNNIVFDHHGAAFLVDFGSTALDGAPNRLGGFTPAVAAPERLQGGPPTAAGDVYSLAASLLWAADSSGGVAASLRSVSIPALERSPGLRPDAASYGARLQAALASPE